MNNASLVKTRKKVNIHSLTLYIGAILIFAIFSILSAVMGKNFLQWNNIVNIIVQSSIISVIAVGQTIVIITGGIDLSVGSIVAFVGIFMGMLLLAGIPLVIAILIALIIGAVFGVINGVVISYGKVPPFIMTLGMMSIGRGLTLAINGGKPLAGFPMELEKLATFKLGPIPSFVIYVAVIYTVMVIVLNKTRFGRYTYAIGGNRAAARLSGVNSSKIEMLVYMLSGVFSAIGGVLLLSRLCYAAPTAGNGYEMDAIAAVVIGGASMSGGQGKLINTLVGALILGTLKAGLTILNVPVFYQQIVIGIAIIGAVFLDKAKERKAE